MKYEIIYTDDYALILSDVQIKDVIPFIGHYHLEQGQIINQFPNYLTDLDACKLIIAHRPLTDAPILGWTPILPSFSWNQQHDVEFYNKARETYKYTEEDLIKAFKAGHSGAFVKGHTVPHYKEYIESFQESKRPKYFTIKTVKMNLDEIREQGKGFLNANTDKSVTINSQGRTELIGEYEQQ